MKYTFLLFLITLFLSGCSMVNYNRTELVTPTSTVEEMKQLQERILTLEEQLFYLKREMRHIPIVTPDESAAAKQTLIDFFDLLSQKQFAKAVPLLSTDYGVYDPLYQFNPEETDPATLLSSYCENVGTCLEARVLKVSHISNYDYELTVQFINPDRTIYVFGPCCGATEEDMPSKDTFTYVVRKDFEDKMVVMTPPLYRP